LTGSTRKSKCAKGKGVKGMKSAKTEMWNVTKNHLAAAKDKRMVK
jgi:hypothetical protein